MAKKDDLKAELTKLGIAFDEDAKVAELEALLPAGDEVLTETEDAPEANKDEIEVGDPEVLRPTTLPLVITPTSGSWKNDEQALYAQTLNAAAYSFPQRWKEVKAVEIARLKEIGENPERYYFYTGTQKGEDNLQYKNKLID